MVDEPESGRGVAESVDRRWQETWSLAGRAAPTGLLARLVERYSEPHRAYHDLQHVRACLDLAASVREQLVVAVEVELALWYHDAVYDPRRADNEEQSARLAASELAGLPAQTVASIGALILATRHQALPEGSDAQFVVDIDLAILGSPPDVFDAYEAAIRREYDWVPEPIFRHKRREVLQSFLVRPQIYSTAHLHAALETAARDNLTRSIARLA